MKRMPTEFYRDVQELRSRYGDQEYSRNTLVPHVVALIEEHRKDLRDELLNDQAIKVLDALDKADDRNADGLFSYDGHIALGATQRIKRSAMNLQQHYRRKRVIDTNKAGQDRAWAEETEWLNEGMDALSDMPSQTKRRDVLTEESKPVKSAVLEDA